MTKERTNNEHRRWRVARKELLELGVLACFCCGRKIYLSEATLEHIKARVNGGKNALSNLALSHQSCNSARADSESPRHPAEESPLRFINKHTVRAVLEDQKFNKDL